MQKKDDWKYTLNINLEKDYRYFAQIAHSHLQSPSCPGITLNACGNAIVSLLKVSSLLSEYVPGLHKETSILLKSCFSCKSKELKNKAPGVPNEEERLARYMEKASPFEDKWPTSSQFMHKCQI